jgi:TolB protein
MITKSDSDLHQKAWMDKGVNRSMMIIFIHIRIRSCLLTLGLLLSIMMASAPHSIAQYDYIDITKPSLRKIPTAIPVFKAINRNVQEIEIGKKGADILSEVLNFTGYFSMLDRKAFLVDPQELEIIGTGINFKNWTVLGAELLVTSGVAIQDGILHAELRLFDTLQQKMLVGKKYTGAPEDLRKIMRRFAGEIVFYLTGNRGIFDSNIAFISTGTGKKEIYICDFDGHDVRQFTNHKSITLFPAWSGDGQWIAYTSYVKGKPDLYIQNVKQKRGFVVAREGINSFPAWVPGRFELAATLSFSGDQEIYLLSGEGKIIKQLTTSEGIDISPAWSPDGKQMAFVSRRAGSPQIYIKNIETGNVRRLTFQGNYNTQPAWSPLGDKIAYSTMDHAGVNISVIKADGSGTVRLTHNSKDNESPSWAPDGSMIVFSSTREGSSRLYVMTAFGTDQRRLLNLPGEQSNPKWSPNVGDSGH